MSHPKQQRSIIQPSVVNSSVFVQCCIFTEMLILIYFRDNYKNYTGFEVFCKNKVFFFSVQSPPTAVCNIFRNTTSEDSFLCCSWTQVCIIVQTLLYTVDPLLLI